MEGPPAATPLPVDNRTVLHLLAVAPVPRNAGGEARRLSFRALDIEQIGHVYEGLLDHTAKRADRADAGPDRRQGTRSRRSPCRNWSGSQAKGEDDLLKFLQGRNGPVGDRPQESAGTPSSTGDAASRFRTACGDDEALCKRVQPVRRAGPLDTFDYPVVIRTGSVFVTAGTDRRSSGTHYTPRSLTEPIVQYTLEPLVYVGPAEGKPKEEWKLRSAKELLDLKICDMACGSGAFLVQACRYLSERLLEAWEDAEQRANPGVAAASRPRATASTGAARTSN